MAHDRKVDPALDAAALERLFANLEKPIFNFALRWLRSPSEAADVTQEAFLRVWRARERVEVATVEPLLYRTALNLARNRHRSARLWGWLGLAAVSEPQSAIPLADAAIERADAAARVRAAIEALPERLKQVVLLCELSELSYTEASAVLGIPVGTVGSRRNKALALLAERLGPLEGEGS